MTCAGAIERGESLAPFMKQLNEIRRAHPALQQLRNLRFHHSENDGIIVYSKRDAATGDTVLVVCTTDPHHVRDGWVHLRMEELGVNGQRRLHRLRTCFSGANYEWGEHNFVRLSPTQVAHVFAVHPH